MVLVNVPVVGEVTDAAYEEIWPIHVTPAVSDGSISPYEDIRPDAFPAVMTSMRLTAAAAAAAASAPVGLKTLLL